MNLISFRQLRPFLFWGILTAFSLFISSAGGAEDEVVVISPHWNGIKEETSRAFSSWHEKKYGRPVVIRWREAGGGTSEIMKFLRSEYQSSPSTGIDIFYGGGVDPFRDLEQDGLLTRYDPPADILAQIPAKLNGMDIIDPNHEWFGVSLAGFGIIINERVRSAVGLPAVHTWADLADPRLKGWISGCDPRQSGSVLAIYETILQTNGWEKGWDILMAMSGNIRSFFPGAPSSALEVGMGDAAYGVSIDLYGNAQVGYYGAENVSFILPEGQTVITPDSIAILKNPPHLELAQHFVEFTLSRDNQLLWMLPKGAPDGAIDNIINRMSVWPSLYDELANVTPIKTNPFKTRSDFVLSGQLSSKRRAILSALIGAWMIDPHDSLVRAWTALHSPAMQKLYPEHQQALMAEFMKPPCTEEELLQLTDDWKKPGKKTALINRWQNEALKRYKDIVTQLGSR